MPANTQAAPKKPLIQTPLPGPETQALIARDQQSISPSYTRGYPLSVARAEGAMVQDLDGNWFLDFCAGIAVCATGHCHPQVVHAICEQAGKFLHMSGTDFYYDNMVVLAERLCQASGEGGAKKVFFCNSGTEGTEGALKLARYHTGRPGIISFYRGFHGRTYGAMSISASKAVHRHGFAPFIGGTYLAHYPNPYRPFFGKTDPAEEAEACLDFIRDTLFKTVISPNQVAAMVLETIQGEGGYVVPPANWLPGLRELCDRHGILLLLDEVQAGMGRTGKLWAYEHDGIVPDIMWTAKGIASGMPLGAIMAKADIMSWPPGAHATTYGGNPVACAAALATLDLVENGLMQNAARQGDYLMDRLKVLAESHTVLGDVRGRGLMVGVEIVDSQATRGKNGSLRNGLVDRCFEKGLLVLGAGDNTIRFCPPLIIDQQDVDTAVTLFSAALQEAP